MTCWQVCDSDANSRAPRSIETAHLKARRWPRRTALYGAASAMITRSRKHSTLRASAFGWRQSVATNAPLWTWRASWRRSCITCGSTDRSSLCRHRRSPARSRSAFFRQLERNRIANPPMLRISAPPFCQIGFRAREWRPMSVRLPIIRSSTALPPQSFFSTLKLPKTRSYARYDVTTSARFESNAYPSSAT